MKNEEDYIVAGRRLPLSLATATLLATWFGAGILLTATDEICAEGLRITVPGYIGWIAVQLVALAGIVELFFEIQVSAGIPMVAFIAMLYTLIGGMWSVTITDAIQMALVIPGIFLLGQAVLAGSGGGSLVDGVRQISQAVDPEHLILIPRDTMREFVGWVSVLAVSAIGNLPGQDLFQRVLPRSRLASREMPA